MITCQKTKSPIFEIYKDGILYEEIDKMNRNKYIEPLWENSIYSLENNRKTV